MVAHATPIPTLTHTHTPAYTDVALLHVPTYTYTDKKAMKEQELKDMAACRNVRSAKEIIRHMNGLSKGERSRGCSLTTIKEIQEFAEELEAKRKHLVYRKRISCLEMRKKRERDSSPVALKRRKTERGCCATSDCSDNHRTTTTHLPSCFVEERASALSIRECGEFGTTPQGWEDNKEEMDFWLRGMFVLSGIPVIFKITLV